MNAVEKKLLFIVNPRAGKTKSRAPPPLRIILIS